VPPETSSDGSSKWRGAASPLHTASALLCLTPGGAILSLVGEGMSAALVSTTVSSACDTFSAWSTPELHAMGPSREARPEAGPLPPGSLSIASGRTAAAARLSEA
jgi:hypothetical protein